MITNTHHLRGLTTISHEFEIPLDHSLPNGRHLTIFAREVRSNSHANPENLPFLVFFQGGPGSASPRPDANSGWLKRALQTYRVLLLDQRGTGLSSPVNHQTLEQIDSPQAQANYLKHFRADAIIRDAEWIRKTLIGDEKWAVLGQSYGGFCICNYLSSAPHGLNMAIITGGLPSLTRHPDEVYRATYKRVLQKNNDYFDQFPKDEHIAKDIATFIAKNEVYLNDGARLSVQRFQQLGLMLGASDGFIRMHYLLENAFTHGKNGRTLNYVFLRELENAQNFETNPIFAILHEAIYCQNFASNWSANRIRNDFPEFNFSPDQPFLFTGEMIYPWMFDEYPNLRPLKAASEILAKDKEWSQLYNLDVLQNNRVPCAAAIYYNDMYVERTYSEETATQIRGLKTWVTSEYEHNGLRADGEHVLNHLLSLIHN
jgi:pimeloyl-ACP methyl ester carboxylesterase